jgi:hypothetical protein
MLSDNIIKKMMPEQRKWLSRQGNRARELIRLAQEPPEYLPTPKAFQRFAIIGSLEFDEPKVRTALFFDCGHTGWYRIVIGTKPQPETTGWYNGIQQLASLIPATRIII